MSTLLALHSAAHSALEHLAPLADPPKPGQYNGPAVGTGAPPGGDQFSTILGWAKWVVTGIAVLGFMVVAGRMMIANRQHQGSDHGSSLGWIALGCVLLGVAPHIVGALIG